jgi:hypothetical protein
MKAWVFERFAKALLRNIHCSVNFDYNNYEREKL